MRVILVGNAVPPEVVGGLPRYVRELASALSRAGCETVLLAKRVDPRSPESELAPDGVRILRHSMPSKRNPLFAPAYPLYSARGVLSPARAARRQPGTVVHAHFAVTALPLALGGVPYVLTFHAPLWRELLDERQESYHLPAAAHRPAVAALRAAERTVVKRSRSVFVLSEYMRGHLGELSQAAASTAQLLPGGVDIDRFSPDPSTPREEGLLFTARRLTPRTGVDRLIAALPAIVAEHPEARLAIAGTGEMEAELRALASRLGVAERVLFLGQVTDDELLGWYRRAALVVVPTVKLEGFGLTIAEALACGTPVLGTPVGAIPELLEPLDACTLARDNSAPSLAEAVNRLLGDPVRLAAIRAGARARVAPALSWDAVARRYLEAYEATLATAASSSAASGSSSLS